MKHTRPEEVVAWLTNLATLAETKSCKAPEFFRPFHFTTLALVLKANRAGRVELPDSIKSYATRMHLWEAIGLRPPMRVNENDAVGKFLPIEPLRSREQVADCAKRVSGIATRAMMNEESRESLSTALSELIDNCFSHACITDGLHGLACAQYWPKGNLLQIAITDAGIGIKESFKNADSEEMRNRAALMNSCTLATELHASSKLHHGHAGYGLALARQLAESNGGTVGVYSCNEWFHCSHGVSQENTLDVPWQGTLVIVEFNTAQTLSTQQVYQSWPPVRGYTNDDFDI